MTSIQHMVVLLTSMNKVHGPLGLVHPSHSYVGTEVAEGDFSLAQAGS